MTSSLRRIYGMLLRNIFTLRRSITRILSYIFWPMLQMLLWGFLSRHIGIHGDLASIGLSSLLAITLFLTFFERTNSNVMMTFLEDVWSRNVGNIFISPLKPMELMTGLLFNGLFNISFGMVVTCLCAYLFFDYSIATMGAGFFWFWLCLTLSGWCVGIFLVSMLLRFGPSGEFFGWMFAFGLSPFLCAYYPVTTLPEILRPLALALPPTHVFEALRQWIEKGTLDWTLIGKSLGLNAIFLIVCIGMFFRQLRHARITKGLFAMAE